MNVIDFSNFDEEYGWVVPEQIILVSPESSRWAIVSARTRRIFNMS